MSFKLTCDCGKPANIVTNIINESEIELGVMCKSCNIYSCLNYIKLSTDNKKKKPETDHIKIIKNEVEQKTIYNDEEFKKYLEFMYSKQRNGFAPGYLDIARNTNIAVEKCRSIKGELQRRGIIKTVANRTRILKEAN